MANITAAQQTQIFKIVSGLFNAAPGATYLTEFAGLIAGGATMLQLSEALANTTSFTTGIMGGKVTVAAQTQQLMTNLGLTYATTPDAATAAGSAQNWFDAQITAGRSFGAIVNEAVEALSSSTWVAANPLFSSTATTLTNKATVAEYYSVTLATSSTSLSALQSVVSSVTSTTAVATTADLATAISAGGSSGGSTFTLTSSIDSGSSFLGTSGNDTFNAIHSSTAASKTFNSFDSISGGSGTDILNLYAIDYTSGASVDVATASGIETVNVRATGTATSIISVVASNFSGMTTFNDDRSTSAVTVTGLASGTTVGFIGNGAITNDALSATYGASVTAGTLAISGGTTAGAVDLNGAGLKTIAITSTTAANTTGVLASNTAVATAVTIAADKSLVATGLTLAGAGTAVTLTVSGAATNVAATSTAAAKGAVTLGALDTEFASVNAAGLTAGGVSATLSATAAATFVGGLGDDIITTSNSGQTGSIDAGAGTGDKLVLANTVDINSTAEYAIYKNFEVIQLNDSTALDLSLMSGSTFTSVAINAGANAVTATNLSATQAANVTLGMASTVTITLTSATTVGTIDTLNLTVTDGDTSTGETTIASGFLTIAGVETINITATDDLVLSSMSAVTGVSSLKISGSGDVNITTGVHVATANEAINFSGLTVASTFNFAGTTTNAMAFTGGAGVDTVTDSVIGGNVITTGAGKDVISLTDKTSGSTTIITGGAAADTVSVAAGGSAFDVLKFVYAAGDSVSDSSQTNGISAALTDVITNLDGTTLVTAGGSSVTFDTEVSATAVTQNGATAVTFGTSAVTNAYDFLVVSHSATAVTIYQDTDGDKIIETGEFAVSLTGIVTAGFTGAEFSISGGNLVLASAG